jgi:ATP-binding cassette subfamily B protein
MTAMHNIRIGRLDHDDPDHARLHGALRQSGADEVVETLPHGENTVLSKEFRDGQDLSGGQWQRIGIARGIYRDATILIADEPTAALDAKAEARVFASLHEAAQHRTTILVTTGWPTCAAPTGSSCWTRADLPSTAPTTN